MTKNQKTSKAKPETSLMQRIALVVLGIFCCVILLEVGLRIGGMAATSLQKYSNFLSIEKQKSAYRILCLGESTTTGPYPRLLEKILNGRVGGTSFSVINGGVPSTTTNDILLRLEDNINRYRPDLVVVMMGINDELSRQRLLPVNTLEAGTQNPWRFLKVYKLMKYLLLHIENKIERMNGAVQNPFRENELSYGLSNTNSVLEEKMIPPERSQLRENALVDSGSSYLAQGRYSEAEHFFTKAIEEYPDNVYAYLGLARIMQYTGRSVEAGELLQKAMRIAPENESVYLERGWYFRGHREYFKAEESFKRLVKLNGLECGTAYLDLASIYLITRKYPEAEDAFKEVLKRDPQNIAAQRGLLSLYKKTGIRMPEGILGDRKLTKNYYSDVTRNNFRRLKNILDRRRIPLIFVQYPMRSVAPLKKIFPEDDGVIFVDNEEIFMNALRNGNYDDYFTDMFGGDFGHCTDLGNKLLAKQIAGVILKEVLGIK